MYTASACLKGGAPKGAEMIPDGALRTFLGGPAPDVRVDKAISRAGTYVVTGSIRHWRPTQSPVTITFHADWTTRRGIGACYAFTPSVTGAIAAAQAATATLEARTGNDIRQFAGGYGHTTLTASGRTLIDDADRPPTAFSDTGYVWDCRAGSSINVRQPDRTSPPGIPLPVNASDCSAVVPIATAHLEPFRTFVIFVLGALVAFGAQMVYDGLRRR